MYLYVLIRPSWTKTWTKWSWRSCFWCVPLWPESKIKEWAILFNRCNFPLSVCWKESALSGQVQMPPLQQPWKDRQENGCGEGKSNKQNPEGKSCTDETGKRRTRCPCYSNGQPCSSLCSCKECGNKYGIRKPCSVTDTIVSRKKRMTSSPQSLKRERTTTFLEKTGFKVQSGPWTMEETCLLDTVESFLSATCIVPNYKNITTLFNFVVNSKCVSDLQLAAVKKTERQIQAKLDFVRKRGTALQNLYYGVSAVGNWNLNLN